ncbi:RluA family pseudouridine synthase [Baekduia soli]|uniref:Pseudouridine synthase n=1 Tax=Baekduia soli TaxID=496014 RepID=A0A5B8U7P0_9ACTN|nr:RluA family pseudouridine synthase [Baekduia soli]QEC49123.1 RluA family pseudouridine synthase [Baekduia soli]
MDLHVGPDEAGQRLDAFLARPLGSRARAQRLIDAGLVCVGGLPQAKSRIVAAGDLVEVTEPEAPVGPEDVAAGVSFAVPYEDEHLLVVDKPAGLVVHPARGHLTGTLAQALEARAGAGAPGDAGEGWRAGLVHRLDRDTSGLLVVAKTEPVHAALKLALQRRELTREYRALVVGRPPARTGTIEAPIGRDRRERTKMSTDTDTPRSARTRFALVEALPRHSLLDVWLDTGRTHQIRVHLEAIGHPVAGDPTYGAAGDLGLERQFLHAARLAFAHPVTGEALDVLSELPADLQDALQRARGTG